MTLIELSRFFIQSETRQTLRIPFWQRRLWVLGWIQSGNHLVKPLGFIGGVVVGASQAISENMKIAYLGLRKILGWQWPPETKKTDNYSGFQAYV